jgi:predicted amidophosphoribosyltransferase
VEVLLPALNLAVVLFFVFLFVRMAFDIKAVRTMLENQGLFSGVACGWCRMPVPEGAETCGHCGRDLDPKGRSARVDQAQPNDRSE